MPSVYVTYKLFTDLCRAKGIPVAKQHRVETAVAMAGHLTYWLCYQTLNARGITSYAKTGKMCQECMASASEADCEIWLLQMAVALLLAKGVKNK